MNLVFNWSIFRKIELQQNDGNSKLTFDFQKKSNFSTIKKKYASEKKKSFD